MDELRKQIDKVFLSITTHLVAPETSLSLADTSDFLGVHESVLLDLIEHIDLQVDLKTMSFTPAAIKYILLTFDLQECRFQNLSVLLLRYDPDAKYDDYAYHQIKNTFFKLSPKFSFAYSCQKEVENYLKIKLPCSLSTRCI